MIVLESGFSGIDYPMEHPRVCALPVTGTVTASTEAAGFSAIFANNLKTTQWWRPTAVPATWVLDFTAAPISYVAVAAHNCATVGATVELQRWNGVAYVFVASHTPTDNSPIIFLMPRRTMARFAVFVNGAIATIGVISAGDVIEFPQRARYTGSTSFEISDADEYRDTVSEGGQVLDSFITRKSIPARLEVEHLSETWTDSVLQPLRTYAKNFPIFMADRPLSRPKSVVFGRVSKPIQPDRAIPQGRVAMSVSIEVTGHVGA